MLHTSSSPRTTRGPAFAACLLASALLSASASAGPIFTLALDPAESALVPQVGASDALFGTLEVEVGALPFSGDTTLQLLEIDIGSAGGATFALDPTIASAGLGVLFADGSFLIPTLFLHIDVGQGPQDLAISNVMGFVELDAFGSTVVGLVSDFVVDSLGDAGLVSVSIVAVPEPSGALLAVAVITTLSALRIRRSSR